MKVSTSDTPDTPSALLTAVVAAHPRLETVRVFAKGRAGDFDKSVAIITLQGEDGEPVTFKNPPKDTPSDIVATCVNVAKAYTAENGETLYQAQLYIVPGERGPAPKKPQLIAFHTGHQVVSEVNAEAELYIRLSEMLFKQLASLLSTTTALASAQVGMIQSLGGAFATITERERAVATSHQETDIIRIQAQMERDRMAMLDKSLSPVLSALRRKLGVEPSAPTGGSNGESKSEPLAKRARAFVQSFTGKQWDLARSKLASRGYDALDRMRSATRDAEVLGAVADFISENNDAILELYGALDGGQQTAMEELQTAAADAGEAEKQRALKEANPATT